MKSPAIRIHYYLMILPGVLFFILFKYAPMFGVMIAFQNYDPFSGFTGSPWVGLENFQRLFADADFYSLLKNTLLLSLYNLLLFFPAPILLAVLLNEIRRKWFKRFVQTISYMPHFLSWVVIVGITITLFSTQDGGINNLLAAHGFARWDVLTNISNFRAMYVLQNIWKESGWNAVIFLAALASVDLTLYEAAVVDGAGRWRQMWHITLPALRSTIVILFVLRLGHSLETGFEHIYLIQNSANLSVSDVFDTYAYRVGIAKGEFSYATAIGLFKSVVGLLLVVGANRLAKSAGEEGVY